MIFVVMAAYAVWGVQAFSDQFTSHCYALGGPGLENFDNFSNAMLATFVLMSEENYPYIMYPAQIASPIHAAIFFTSFILIMLFALIPLLLALTYSEYKEKMRAQHKTALARKHVAMLVAFHVLQEDPTSVGANASIPFPVWADLVLELRPGISPSDLRLMAETLRQSRSRADSCSSNSGNGLRAPLSLPEVLRTFSVLPMARRELQLYQLIAEEALRKQTDDLQQGRGAVALLATGLSPSVVPLGANDSVAGVWWRQIGAWKLLVALTNAVALCCLHSPESNGPASGQPGAYEVIWACLLLHLVEAVAVSTWLCSPRRLALRSSVTPRLCFETILTFASLFAEAAGLGASLLRSHFFCCCRICSALLRTFAIPRVFCFALCTLHHAHALFPTVHVLLLPNSLWKSVTDHSKELVLRPSSHLTKEKNEGRGNI
jgi:hypothetical protein